MGEISTESATVSARRATPTAGASERLPTWVLALAVLAVWIVLWWFLRGRDTLALPGRAHTDLHETLTGIRDSVLASRGSNPVIAFTYSVGELFRDGVDLLRRMVAIPNPPRPVPEFGWLGVIAIATWTANAMAGWRMALLVCLSFLSFGLLGYWSDAIDLLVVTLVAVLVSVLIGMPLAVLVASNRTANSVISTILDLLQTMPTFVYLGPIVLFFGIGTSGAVLCTLIYALPPIIRVAGHGIRSVSPTTIEATDASGQTAFQRLVKVQLPMARRTIILGLNQTVMAALSMATIAAFVDGPGLGKPVLSGLIRNQVGAAFVPGMLIVVMAVMLDRLFTATSERSELVARGGGGNPRLRRLILGVSAVVALALVLVSRQYLWAARFPTTGWGRRVADGVDGFVDWVTGTFGVLTAAVRNGITEAVLNPLQALIAESPWYVTGAAITALAWVFGGPRALAPTLICLAGIRFLDLWHDAMVTLTLTLVATLLVMALAIVLGVWMARSRRVDLVVRPILDAGQTIPPFVYLVPALALFGPTRFTAIAAAVAYGVPVATKLVADGVRSVSVTTVEASRSTGATTWQEITKVQLPMARGSLVLAANQGLLYVLSMVVIGGMVGAGALGYAVVLGFSRSEEWGKGMAAGLTIVLLGIMIDRIARAAAARSGAETAR